MLDQLPDLSRPSCLTERSRRCARPCATPGDGNPAAREEHMSDTPTPEPTKVDIEVPNNPAPAPAPDKGDSDSDD